MARPRAMPGCPTCPGERCAGHRIATRGPPFSAEPIGSWSRGKCHQLVRFPRLNSATGRCRWFNPRASARHPYQVLSAVAQHLLNLPIRCHSPSQHTPTPRPPAHPKNAWPFYPGASEPLREQPFVCRPAPSLSDHGDADLCHPLIRCRVGPQHGAPARANRRRHWPPPRCRRARATREHARCRWPCSEVCLMRLESGTGKGGSQIDLIHVSDVQLTDFEQTCQRVSAARAGLDLVPPAIGSQSRGTRQCRACLARPSSSRGSNLAMVVSGRILAILAGPDASAAAVQPFPRPQLSIRRFPPATGDARQTEHPRVDHLGPGPDVRRLQPTGKGRGERW